jgi:hypothetical protein
MGSKRVPSGISIRPYRNNPLISLAGGGLGVDIGLFVVLASWVIFSSFAAPWWISRSIMGGGSSGLSAVMAATLGAGARRASSFAYRAAVSAGIGAAGALQQPRRSQKEEPKV